jgi:hypothetical protein
MVLMTVFRMLQTFVLVVGLSCGLPSLALAQDFGVMESAETIDRGTFKLRLNPLLIFGRDGQDDELGVAAKLGYGLTDRFDLEGAVALYDGVRFFGVDAEYWLVRDAAADVSIIGGLHVARGDNTLNTRGIDLTFLASRHVTDRLELYGALDFAFESITEQGNDESFTPIHLVPGLEYRIAEDVDLVAELGVALNDEAWHYLSGGVAFYFR